MLTPEHLRLPWLIGAVSARKQSTWSSQQTACKYVLPPYLKKGNLSPMAYTTLQEASPSPCMHNAAGYPKAESALPTKRVYHSMFLSAPLRLAGHHALAAPNKPRGFLFVGVFDNDGFINAFLGDAALKREGALSLWPPTLERACVHSPVLGQNQGRNRLEIERRGGDALLSRCERSTVVIYAFYHYSKHEPWASGRAGGYELLGCFVSTIAVTTPWTRHPRGDATVY